MRYFSHDTNASTDDKILSLRIKFGGAAIDAYWSIVERLYKDEKPMPFGENQVETSSVCHWLCVGFDELQDWVIAMLDLGLLVNASEDEEKILLWSERVDSTIREVERRSETARQNGKLGGRPPKKKPNETESVSKKTEGKATKTININSYRDSNESLTPKPPKNESAKQQTVPAGVVAEIVSYLNAKTGKDFKATSEKTKRLIKARLNEGYEIDDFKSVIAKKATDWGRDPNMCRYLRPETLFGPKFEGYLNENALAAKGSDRFGKYAD